MMMILMIKKIGKNMMLEEEKVKKNIEDLV